MLAYMNGTAKSIEQIEIQLRDIKSGRLHSMYVDVLDNSLARRWVSAVVDVVHRGLHLEKNYCWLGFPHSDRDGRYICDQINRSITAINESTLDYTIDDVFSVEDLLSPGPVGEALPGLKLDHDRFNRLHRYFEDLQGVSGAMSSHYQQADPETRWHIRQLNLLCHEFETWALSWRKAHYVNEWVRPSQLMCWLQAPRFELLPADYELFGIDSLHRDIGGVYAGVNKAVGKHHWEVFKDEGRDSRINELITTTLRSQTEAAADFDIEWAQDTRGHPWMIQELSDFRAWLTQNGFDADDPALTIGHPRVAQVDIERSFGTRHYADIWPVLQQHLDVFSVSVAGHRAIYDYHWSDDNYMHIQITTLGGH
jgi:hypothetical protein